MLVVSVSCNVSSCYLFINVEFLLQVFTKHFQCIIISYGSNLAKSGVVWWNFPPCWNCVMLYAGDLQ